ncbi:hypothetical protein [Novosphingobium profundi]|uniref:hypothetical protein n=1 Tax=Novosphingobium profundi TaxID=1774954 RepID=UPI001CFD957B|nr:hypothetical protein [Novosphingobium profundi]
MRRAISVASSVFLMLAAPLAQAQEDEAVSVTGDAPAEQSSSAGLAEQLANPVANLISVPLQFNYDCCYGPADGDRLTVNVQPVIPFSVGEDWNLITRTIVPIITQGETVQGAGGMSGLGDVVQSFFLSPKEAKNGLVWGVGPAILYPTGKTGFSAEKWGAGPTAVVLKQGGGMTYGLLANHIWSFAGDSIEPGVSATFIQPFVTKTLPDSTAFTINTETTRDWKRDTWTVPINFVVSHVYSVGKQPISLAVGARYYAERPEGGPNWGARFVATFLFPQ